MIDTCDPKIAGWSDNGETFVIKDPVKFEEQIIPQFFKHNKFSSFVRVRIELPEEFRRLIIYSCVTGFVFHVARFTILLTLVSPCDLFFFW